MGATSVTGIGKGESNGRQKLQNHCGGCGCGTGPEVVKSVPTKSVCSVRLVTGSGKRTHRTGGVGRIAVCS